ncbi:spore germination protein [Priestia megaterium]|nr:spore germination protein [Priestia megaterium]
MIDVKKRVRKRLSSLDRKLDGIDSNSSHSEEMEKTLLNHDLAQNELRFKETFHNCSDVQFRQIYNKGQPNILLLYVSGLIDEQKFSMAILNPLTYIPISSEYRQLDDLADFIRREGLAIGHTQLVCKYSEVIMGVLRGNVAIIVDGEATALLAEVIGFDKRGIEEPTTEVSILGPKEGFTETLTMNISLLRRRIRSHHLKLESFVLGDLSQTDVVVAYIDGIAKSSIVEEVRNRISRIHTDSIYGSSAVEEFIEDMSFSPFPQIMKTERPDTTVTSLLEGQVVILEDGSPYAAIVPMTFWAALQSAEDYFNRSLFSSAVRWIRFTLFLVSLLLPSIYVSIVSFHPQLIPTHLLLSITAAREPTPFPTVVEALLMEFMFEALREAGLRLPRATGSAISIVGALVIGQSAVQAGIVSAPMVIVVATTGIASFAIPRYNFSSAVRMLRFPLLILAGMLGFYGVAVGVLIILIHLVNLRSFGVPYMTSVAPQYPFTFKDIFIRAPKWAMRQRPFVAGEREERVSSRAQSQTERKMNNEKP